MKSDEMSLEASRANGTNKNAIRYSRDVLVLREDAVLAPFTVAGSSASSCENGTYAQFGAS